MSIYYQDDQVTLYHGDAFEVMESLKDTSMHCVITDPPFDSRTHSMARSNRNGYGTPGKGNRVLSGKAETRFDSFDHDKQLSMFAEMGRVTRGWVVSNVAADTGFRFEVEEPPLGLKVLRVGAWVKTNPMPIISADRPAMGWEPIVYMHREDVKPRWNGGGKALNFVLPTSRGSGHATQKPLPMVQAFVRMFSDPGDTVFDPFSGTGTTLRAALDEGRKAVGVELEERYCEMIARRLDQGVLDFGGAA